MENIIKKMEFDCIDWIRRYDLAGEYNKYWADIVKHEPGPTGLTLIDFCLFYASLHKEEID